MTSGSRRLFLAGLVVAVAWSAPAARAENAQPAAVTTHPASAAQLVDAYLAAWNAHDAAKAGSFFAADGVYYDASTGTPQKGREAAQKNVIESFMKAAPDLVWKRDGDAIVGKDAVAFEWTFSGTNTGDWGDGTKATGKKFSFKGATVIRFSGDKFAFEGDYYDALGFFKQLGLM